MAPSPSVSFVEAQFRALQPSLRRFLYAMVRDRALADDLLQDTFLEACRTPERLMAAGDPAAWLFQVARRRALNAHRSAGRFRGAVERLAGRREQRDDDYRESTDAAAALALLDGLDGHERALVLLRYVHGFEAQELAEITERSPAAVRKQLERLRGRLAARLGTEETEEMPG
jgi:RNA polymerase sigma factor (sigma-70 family)